MSDQPGVIMKHKRSGHFIDEQVDQFDAFAISWNGEEAIHLTFGRTSIGINTSSFVMDEGKSKRQSGEIDVFRLDVGAITMPVRTARGLVATLNRMIAQAEARSASDE